MRDRNPARLGRARRSQPERVEARAAHRHQSRRCHRAGRRSLWQWRQRCRAAGINRRSRRHLHLARGTRPGARQARGPARRSRRCRGQEHRAAGSGVPRSHRRAEGRRPSEHRKTGGERRPLDRRPALHQHERRPRTGIFQRRHHRRHHHRSEQDPGPARDCAQLLVFVQGQGRRHRRDLPAVPRSLCA